MATPTFQDWTAAGGSPAAYTEMLKEVNLGKQLELQSLGGDFALFDFGSTTNGGSLDPSPRDGQGVSLSQASDAGDGEEGGRFFDAEQGALTPSEAARAREEDDEEDDDEDEGENSTSSGEDDYLLGVVDEDDDSSCDDYDYDDEEGVCGVCQEERREQDGMCDTVWFDVVDWEDRLDGCNEFIIVPNIQTGYVETGGGLFARARREEQVVEGDPTTCIVWGDFVEFEDFSEDYRHGDREEFLARVSGVRAFIRAHQGCKVTHEAFVAAVPDEDDRLGLMGMDGSVDIEPYDDEHNATAEQKAAFAEEIKADIEEEEEDEAEAMRGALNEIEEHFTFHGIPIPYAQAKAAAFAEDASLDTIRAAYDDADAAYEQAFEDPQEELEELHDAARDLHSVLDLLLDEFKVPEGPGGEAMSAVMSAPAVLAALAAKESSLDDDTLPKSARDYPARAAELRAVVGALQEGVAFLAGTSRKRKRKAVECLAVAEIKAEQRSTGLIIHPTRFELLAREIAQDFKTDLHFEEEAFEALQTAAEAFLVEAFDKANGLAVLVGGREKLTREDLQRAVRDMPEFLNSPMYQYF